MDTAVATFFVQFEWMTSSLRCTVKLEEIRYTNLDQYRHNCVLSNSDLFTATVSNSMPIAAALRTASFDSALMENGSGICKSLKSYFHFRFC